MNYLPKGLIQMDAYTKSYTRVNNLMKKYFKVDNETHSMIFTGEKLECRAMARFETYGLFSVSDVVSTVAIMDLIVDDKYCAPLHMLSKITMDYKSIRNLTVKNVDYKVITLHNGDRFMTNIQLVKDKNVFVAAYQEFTTFGRIPYWIRYTDLFTILDQARSMCDLNLPIDHAIYETIHAYLSRSKDNLHLQYRYTDMGSPFEYVGMRDIGFSTDSATGRVMGAYFKDGLIPTLTNEFTHRHIYEDIIRGLPLVQTDINNP